MGFPIFWSRRWIASAMAFSSLLAFFGAPARGQTAANWVNPVSGPWTDVTLWSTNPAYPNNGQPLPGDTYHARIAATGGEYTIALASDIALSALTLNASQATFDHTAGLLGIDSAMNIAAGTFLFGGGTITLGAGASMSIGSRFDWSNGTLNGPGTVNVAPGGVMSIGSLLSSRFLTTVLNNSGDVICSGGSLNLVNATFNNQSGGALLLGQTFRIAGTGSSLLNNSGVIVANSLSTGSVVLAVNTSNSGTIVSATGSLVFGGTLNSHTGASVLGGNGTLQLGTVSIGHNVTGSLTLAGSNVRLDGGGVSGAGDVHITGTLHWSGGTISGAGALNVLPGGVLNLGSPGVTRSLARALNNNGVINLTSGSLTLSNAVLHNHSGGVINLTAPVGVFFPGGSGGQIYNSGTIAVGTSGTLGLSPGTFTNSGTIVAGAASLGLGGNWIHQTGSYITGPGTISISPFGMLLSGTTTFAGSSMILSSGSIGGAGDLHLTGRLNWENGTFAGAGALNVHPGAVLNLGTMTSGRFLGRALNNSGTINFSNGSLGFPSGTLTPNAALNNLAGGVLNISSPLPFSTSVSNLNRITNAGTIAFNPSAGIGTTAVTIGQALGWINSGTMIANGPVIINGGTFAHQNNSVLTGDGLFQIANAGVNHVVAADSTLILSGSNMLMNGGAIFGAGTAVLSGSLTWNVGFLGLDIITPDAVLNSTTFSSGKALGGTINNSGLIVLSAGSHTLQDGGLNNLAGGVINISATFPFAPAGSFGGLNNAGTIRTVPGTTGTVTFQALPLVNSGTIVAESGTLVFGQGTFTHTSGAWVGGPANIALTADFSTTRHLTSGTVTLAGQNMILRGGTFDNSGNLIIAGELNWIGGNVLGTGTVTIPAGGVLNFGSLASSRTLSQELNNSGIINFNTQGLVLSSGTINNLAGGVVNFNVPGSINGFSSTSMITNLGTMNFGSFIPGVPVPSRMENSGTLLVNAGSIAIGSGTITHSTGAYIGGAGSMHFGERHILNGTLTLAGMNMNLGFSSGSISGAGSAILTGKLDWAGNSILGGPAVMRVESGGVLNLVSGGFSRTLSRVLDNYGTANYTSGLLRLDDGTFNNLAGGVLNLTAEPNFTTTTGTALLTNDGTINVPAGSINIIVPFSNTGTVVVGHGGDLRTRAPGASLSISGPIAQLTGDTLTAGTWVVGADSALSLGSGGPIAVNQARVLLNGNTASFPQIDGLAENQGMLTLARGRDFPTTGSLNNSGTVRVESGGALVIAGVLINTGTIELDGSLIVDYTGPSPLSALVAQIGTHIIASDPSRRIGYAEASALNATSFAGFAVDSTAALFTVTFDGDTDLDGDVDVADLGALASNWQGSGDWLGGDFDYSGTVDVNDLGLLASNWQAGVGSPLGPAAMPKDLTPSGFTEAASPLGLPPANVPEPASAITIGLLLTPWPLRRLGGRVT
jgi:hypothetical protein